MSDHRVQPPIRLLPAFSRRLAALVLLTHGAALAAALALPGPWRLAAIGVTLSLAYHWWVHVARRAPWSVASATWDADGRWQVVQRRGREIEARLSPATFVSTWLVVLSLRSGALGRIPLPLFPDALDPEVLRRLRVRLRLEGGRQPAGPPAA
jgi:toxin CptA